MVINGEVARIIEIMLTLGAVLKAMVLLTWARVLTTLIISKCDGLMKAGIEIIFDWREWTTKIMRGMVRRTIVIVANQLSFWTNFPQVGM